MNNISEHERYRRGEHARDSRAALAQNETLEQRLAKRDAKADFWAQWFRHKMDNARCADPVTLLPDALAKLEQMIDDRVAIAVKEIKATLRKALEP
jgi:hypothetical protein